jgi:hypothetical protein
MKKMFYKKKYLITVYSLYIDGLDVQTIGHYLKLTDDEVNEIIDYINQIIT